MKEMMPMAINRKMRRIVTMKRKEERKRIKRNPNLSQNQSQKERIRKKLSLRKSQNASNNDVLLNKPIYLLAKIL